MTAVPEPLALYEAKALAELADADALAGVAEGGWSGDPLGAVVLVVSGAATGRTGDDLLPADLGEAVGKALAALGFEEGSTFVIASRPGEAGPGRAGASLAPRAGGGRPPARARAGREAADDLAAAFGLPGLDPGAGQVAGRVLGSARGDFAASLADPHAKAPGVGRHEGGRRPRPATGRRRSARRALRSSPILESQHGREV